MSLSEPGLTAAAVWRGLRTMITCGMSLHGETNTSQPAAKQCSITKISVTTKLEV